MVTDGPLLLYERLSGAGAGWGNQMFPAALLGRVGLLAFPDSQSPGVGGFSTGGTGFCARGPVGQPSQGELCGGGAGPRVLNSGDRTCLLCGVSLLPSVWNVSELAGSGAGGRQAAPGVSARQWDTEGGQSWRMAFSTDEEGHSEDLSDLPKVIWLVGSK